MTESVTGLEIGQERFLFSLAFGYVLALVQRFLLVGQGSTLQNLYSLLVGSLLYYYNFGWEIVHPLLAVTSTWVLLKGCSSLKVDVKITNFILFFFNFGYLLAAYWVYATDDYDLNWTTPHCVLTLRLIGLAYDVTDGTKDLATVKDAVQKERALPGVPSLLDVLGFSFHYSGLLIGPQFSFALYDRYLKGTLLLGADGKPIAISSLPMPVLPALRSLFVGILYLGITQVGGLIIPTSKILDVEWMMSLSMVWRCIWIAIWGRFNMMTYLGLWKFSEGAGILSGFGAQIDPVSKQLNWDRLGNVKLLQYESATNTREVIGSFNINTNAWCQHYVQQRLMALGLPKIGADLSTLMFLAIWHGFHLGYFIAFATEWIMLEAEKRIMSWTNPIKRKVYGIPKDPRGIHFDPHGGGFLGYTYSLIGYFIRSFAISIGMVAFSLFKPSKIFQVWGTLYYWPLIFCFVVIALDFGLNALKGKKKSN